MRLEPGTAVAVPDLIGVLACWCLVLAGPVLVLRRCRRRRVATDVHRDAGRAEEPLAAASLLDSPGGRAGRAAMTSGASEEPHPGRRAVRLASGMLDPLCRYVDFHRRLELAVSELERRLSALPRDRWRIEPYPLTGERGNTLLVLGEGGVFVISATYAPGHWDDVVAASRLGSQDPVAAARLPRRGSAGDLSSVYPVAAAPLVSAGRSRCVGRGVADRGRLA